MYCGTSHWPYTLLCMGFTADKYIWIYEFFKTDSSKATSPTKKGEEVMSVHMIYASAVSPAAQRGDQDKAGT